MFYKGVKDKDNLDSLLILDDSKGTSEASMGGLFAFAFNLSSEHQIGGNVFYSRSGISTGRVQDGYWLQELGRDRVVTNRILTYLERDILSYQVRGEHFFSSFFGVLECILFHSTGTWSTGVLEYWVRSILSNPTLHYSNTPTIFSLS